MLPSPPQQKMEWRERKPLLSRLNKPTLQGLGVSSLALLKRPRPPALSAVVRPSDIEPAHSAYPVLAASGFQGEDNSPKVPLPLRRAFSALIDGPDMSSPAQVYAKRQQITHLSVYFIQYIWSRYWWLLSICNGPADVGPLGAVAHVTRVGSS